MDAQPAQTARPNDNDVVVTVRTWEALTNKGADVPDVPTDLDLRHLAHASRSGIDVGAILRTAMPRSAGPVRSAA